MNKDKEIDELFKRYNPEVNAEDIMTRISDKLDLIDTIRPEHERMNRFHRTVSVCCFIVGLLAGGFFMGIVFFHPFGDSTATDLLFMSRRLPETTLLLSEYRDMILSFLAAASVILGSLPLLFSSEWTSGI